MRERPICRRVSEISQISGSDRAAEILPNCERPLRCAAAIESAGFLAPLGLQKSAGFLAPLGLRNLQDSWHRSGCRNLQDFWHHSGCRNRATALAHTKVSYATTMRQPPEMPGLGAAVRPFGHWRHPVAALGCLGDASSMFGRLRRYRQDSRAAWGSGGSGGG